MKKVQVRIDPFDVRKNKALYGECKLDRQIFDLMDHLCDANIYKSALKRQWTQDDDLQNEDDDGSAQNSDGLLSRL